MVSAIRRTHEYTVVMRIAASASYVVLSPLVMTCTGSTVGPDASFFVPKMLSSNPIRVFSLVQNEQKKSAHSVNNVNKMRVIHIYTRLSCRNVSAIS